MRKRIFELVNTNGQYVAMYDYNARLDGDLTFTRGDRLIILNNCQGDWWEASSLSTGQKGKSYIMKRVLHFIIIGYVPSNYVAPADSLEAQPWFCGTIRRAEAERSLSRKPPGTFLVREAETSIGCYR